MNYAIVTSSRTGNTAFLAQKLAEALPAQDCVFAGAPGQTLPDADLIFVGFWTDKGDCPPDAAAFLARLRGKRVFLFGTAGFGGSQQYFAEILGRVRAHLDASNTVAGQFMCQGRMPQAVRRRFEAMPLEQAAPMLQNFDRALSHPDDADAAALAAAAKACLERCPNAKKYHPSPPLPVSGPACARWDTLFLAFRRGHPSSSAGSQPVLRQTSAQASGSNFRSR